MKRFLTFLFITAIATTAAAQSAAMRPAFVESITVSGTGRSTVAPDRFTFSVGVQTVAGTVDDAISQNNRRVASVISALKAAGASDENIQTSQFNIWPQQDHREGQLPRIIGYHVSNQVTVRSSKVAEAGKLLGVAIGAGVNSSSGISFEVSDPARGRDEGLRAAFQDAKAKATLLAQASGRNLGKALLISEGVQQMPPPQPMARGMAMEVSAAANVPIESGTQELTYTVSVTFELY
jgi:uncharacterized protein YggE